MRKLTLISQIDLVSSFDLSYSRKPQLQSNLCVVLKLEFLATDRSTRVLWLLFDSGKVHSSQVRQAIDSSVRDDSNS